MKKIGILTYHSVCNFGANLQALSTVGYFRKHGFDPIIINWVPFEIERQYVNSVPALQYAEHEKFVADYLPVTATCRSEDDIITQINEHAMDAIVIGSDAVVQHKSLWSRIHFPTRTFLTIAPPPPPHLLFPSPFWGSFVGKLNADIPVIMMSVSSQNEQYLGIQGDIRDKIYEAIRSMSYVSVRDQWTQKMFRHISRGRMNPQITPDPVFSFNQNAGELVLSKQGLSDKFQLPSKYILLSFVEKQTLDERWLEKFVEIAKHNNYECILLPMPKGHILNQIKGLRQLPLPLSPLDWYGLIKYSDAYVGHNMHPMVVAMHNNVPFHIFDYYGIVYLKLFVHSGSSKIYDILRKANMVGQRSRDVGMFCRSPKPQAVFDSIMGLRKENLAQTAFSEAIWIEYNSMMEEIQSSIKFNEMSK